MKKFLKLAALLLVPVLLTGCGSVSAPQTAGKSDTLVVATMNFDGKFSPFFYTNAYENDVLSLVHLPLLGTDREGAVVLEGIGGETRPYNGTDYTYTGIADCVITENDDATVYYDITLRDGVRFSDGVAMDIDDVIFSLYVALDPSYDGIMTVYSLPLAGLEEYRSGDAASVSGIRKTGPMSMQIETTEVSASAIYTLAGIPVAPLHYYGQAELYDYENDSFGFVKGDLSPVRAVTTQPVGAGPYKFVSYTGGTVTLEANENYWKGQPKIRRIQFREGQEADKVPGVVSGTADIAEPSYSVETAKAIANANGGNITGEVLTTQMVANPG